MKDFIFLAVIILGVSYITAQNQSSVTTKAVVETKSRINAAADSQDTIIAAKDNKQTIATIQ